MERDCERCQWDFDQYLSGQLGLEGTLAVEAHLARCAACRDVLEQARAERLASEPGDRGGIAGQAERLLRAFEDARGGRRRKRGWLEIAAPLLVVGGVLLLSIFVALQVWRARAQARVETRPSPFTLPQNPAR